MKYLDGDDLIKTYAVVSYKSCIFITSCRQMSSSGNLNSLKISIIKRMLHNRMILRMKDLKDRDEFHQRMVAKDKEKQKNKMDKKDKRAYEEAAKRLAQVVI